MACLEPYNSQDDVSRSQVFRRRVLLLLGPLVTPFIARWWWIEFGSLVPWCRCNSCSPGPRSCEEGQDPQLCPLQGPGGLHQGEQGEVWSMSNLSLPVMTSCHLQPTLFLQVRQSPGHRARHIRERELHPGWLSHESGRARCGR